MMNPNLLSLLISSIYGAILEQIDLENVTVFTFFAYKDRV